MQALLHGSFGISRVNSRVAHLEWPVDPGFDIPDAEAALGEPEGVHRTTVDGDGSQGALADAQDVHLVEASVEIVVLEVTRVKHLARQLAARGCEACLERKALSWH